MEETILIDYYSKRAQEYERIYRKPERQQDLILLQNHLRRALAGQRVLELACGTGYWTAGVADTVKSILATDASNEVLEIARSKQLDPARVSFARADAYDIHLRGDFTAGFAAFWWSHIPRQKLAGFLDQFHSALAPGARVVFADNRFVPGSNTSIHRRDEAGNTYQLRHLDDGSSHEVLKNFPAREELVETLQPYSDAVEVTVFDYFWCVTYDLNKA
jgi:demethylmenaquinone methyltransferase/2-methoxy-6-polyprenyl-1,4-benzoquinol methylase